MWAETLYGQPAGEVLDGWVVLTRLLAERAGEARGLIVELGLGL